jgi:arsenate reductase (glutaredoxin)
MLIVYTLATCDSCRRAVKWLKAREISFEERAIRDTPPAAKELRTMLDAHDGVMRALFNTAGRDYRDLNLSKVLPTLSPAEALERLARNGNLVKRPFAIGPGVALVGFDEAKWAEAMG